MLTSIATIEDHTFFHGCLRRGGTVVDLGANRGAFCKQLTRHFDVKCFSVEANPYLAKSIAQDDRVKVFNRAITDKDAPITFHLSANPEMSSLQQGMARDTKESVTVQGQTLESFLRENSIEDVDLLKIDIEGAEVQLFASTPPRGVLERIAQITIEFHDFLGAYPPQEVQRMADELKSQGFERIKFSRSNMNWLFFRPDRCRVGGARRVWATHFLRHVRRAFHKLNFHLPVKV